MLGPSGSSAWQVRAGKSCSAPNLTREIHNVSITFLHLALSHVFRIHHKNGFEPMRQKNRMFPSKKPHCRSNEGNLGDDLQLGRCLLTAPQGPPDAHVTVKNPTPKSKKLSRTGRFLHNLEWGVCSSGNSSWQCIRTRSNGNALIGECWVQ